MRQSEGELRIVKRTRRGHGGGHHGGSWKVAYADFVTAMMAFFLVMWIIGLNDNVREAVAAYFRNPVGFLKAVQAGEDPFSVGKGKGRSVLRPVKPPRGEINEQKIFLETKEILEEELRSTPDLKELAKYVKIKVADEGLRIDLVDASVSMFFDTGSAEIKPEFKKLLATVAKELGHLPNQIGIEGHTDNRPYRGRPNYSNWELSNDRANAARRVLEANGLRKGQVRAIIGYADTMPMNKENPTHYTNRRVSIVVAYNNPPGGQQEETQPVAPASKPAAIQTIGPIVGPVVKLERH